MAQVTCIIGIKPETASSVRAGLSISSDIGGQQRLAQAQAVQANPVGLADLNRVEGVQSVELRRA